jgi:hypothetical protein
MRREEGQPRNLVRRDPSTRASRTAATMSEPLHPKPPVESSRQAVSVVNDRAPEHPQRGSLADWVFGRRLASTIEGGLTGTPTPRPASIASPYCRARG